MNRPEGIPDADRPRATLADDAPWRDRIVDLHILTENGDPDAAAIARHWLDQDAEARRVWDEVQQTCDRIRST